MSSARRVLRFGGRVPEAAGVLIVLTALASIVSAPGLHIGTPVALWGLLVPGLVLEGQVWRLLTWVLFASNEWSLLFACVSFYFFAPDLVARWGTRRFLLLFLGAAVLAGLLTTAGVFALHGRQGLGLPFMGAGALSTALIIAWAALNRGRTINFFMVLPMRAEVVVALTVAMTALAAVFSGLTPVLPEVAAEIAALGYIYGWRALAQRLPRVTKRTPKRPPTQFKVWDEKKQEFRPPKFMN